MGIEASVDCQRESSEKTESGEVADGEEGVGTVGLGRGSKESPEGMRVVGRATARREKGREERLDGGAETEARESDQKPFIYR